MEDTGQNQGQIRHTLDCSPGTRRSFLIRPYLRYGTVLYAGGRGRLPRRMDPGHCSDQMSQLSYLPLLLALRADRASSLVLHADESCHPGIWVLNLLAFGRLSLPPHFDRGWRLCCIPSRPCQSVTVPRYTTSVHVSLPCTMATEMVGIYAYIAGIAIYLSECRLRTANRWCWMVICRM